jgi:aminoglycoside phosphotransferase (APT) family kinase protein
MQQAIAQPHAAGIPEELVGTILRATLGASSTVSFTVTNHGEFSNDVAEARLQDGRVMMIKRGRYPWSAGRFRISKLSAQLLRDRAGLVAPRSLDLGGTVGDDALDAYWRIEHPTLFELWPELDESARRAAMRSLGAMMARVHAVELPGHGELPAALADGGDLEQALEQDLAGRLLPAVYGEWGAGVRLVEFLLASVPEVVKRASAAGVLLHGDLHMGNVLCRRSTEAPGCIGLLDLESARSGPPESDLARLKVMHNHLFHMEVDGPWMDWVVEGYGVRPDAWLMRFYAVYHLVELGFYSALVGHGWHAEQVANAAAEVLREAEARGERRASASALA